MELRNSRFWLALGFILIISTVAPPPGHGGQATDQIRTMVDKAIVVLKDPRYKDKAKTNSLKTTTPKILARAI